MDDQSFSVKEFLFNTPLYEIVKVPEKNHEELKVLVDYTFRKVEGYNPIERYDTTFEFKAWADISERGNLLRNGGRFTAIIICRRSRKEFYFECIWNSKKREILKYGQFPSLADFHSQGISRFKKVLNAEGINELSKATGLFAHGIGIGAFVYLRRIFEGLIDQAFLKLGENDTTWKKKYHEMRMDEKISKLKRNLPDFLVENKKLYSILSLGVHELSEADCLKHFKVVKLGIELILNEKLEDLNKKKLLLLAKNEIQKATKELSGKDS